MEATIFWIVVVFLFCASAYREIKKSQKEEKKREDEQKEFENLSPEGQRQELIFRKQQALADWYEMLAHAEQEGDTRRIAKCRSTISYYESELRRLGA